MRHHQHNISDTMASEEKMSDLLAVDLLKAEVRQSKDDVWSP